MQRCKKVANSDNTILLLGETGVRKDYTARFIHDHSPRSDGPFINIDCKTIPDTLIESELFGYKQGAFYGAKEDKPGRLELAEGGTLFINEIGNLPP